MAETPLLKNAKKQYGDIAYVSGLPPQDAWLIDPTKEKIDTPVDELGLIDVSKLISQVKSTISSDYAWPEHLSVHHLYWPANWYSNVPNDPQRIGVRFREISYHKALIPRVFENWLHKVTIEPVVPDLEVMSNRLDSWILAHKLYRSVRKAVQWERRARRRSTLVELKPTILPEEFNGEDIIGKEILADILGTHFKGVKRNLEEVKNIPEVFRFVDPSTSQAELKAQLGKIVAPRALQLVREVAA